MANIERPGVEVSQVVTTTTASAEQSPMVPCIIGPCYQIVDPVATDGSLNSDASVQTAAQVRSSALLVAPLLLSGRKMKVKVDGGDPVNVTFPVTIGGAGISFALARSSLQAQLPATIVEFIDDKLCISSKIKGDASSIELMAVPVTDPTSDAYSVLNMTTGTSTGRSGYDNRAMVVPYTALPSPKAKVTDLVFDGDAVAFYRYYGDKLTRLSKTSAFAWNSWSLGDSKIKNVAIDATNHGNQVQPAIGGRTTLIGRKQTGSKTSVVFHPGTEASITIPLGHKKGGVTGTIWYPDVTGVNYLQVTAVGLQDYLTNHGVAIGNRAGALGNAVKVRFGFDATIDDVDPLILAKADWDGAGDGTLTILCAHATDTTFADLEDAVAAIGTMDNLAIRVTLAFDAALAAEKVFGGHTLGAVGAADSVEYFLRGGTDPINFLTDSSGTAALNTANIQGCIDLNVDADDVGQTDSGALTAEALGIANEILEVSINGSDWVKTTFLANEAPAVTINAALAAATPAGSAALVAVPLENAIDKAGPWAANVLRITGTNPTGGLLHDSTLQVKASTKVLEALFTGTTAVSKQLSNISNTFSGRKSVALTRLAYNPNATVPQEKSIVPGSLNLTLSDLALCGSLVFAPSTALIVDLVNTPEHVKIVHGAAGAVDLTLGDPTAWTSVAHLAAGIDAALVAEGTLDGSVSVSTVTINGVVCLVISDATGISTVKVNTVLEGGTTAGVLAAMNNGAATLAGVLATSAQVGATIKDDGAANLLRISGLSSLTPFKVSAAVVGFDGTNPAHLAPLMLDAALSFVDYSKGNVTLVLAGDSVDAVAADKTCVSAKFVAATDCLVTSTKVWPNCFGPNKPSYTRVFHGKSPAVFTGDTLWSNGKLLGRVLAISALTVGTATYAGAQLTLSEPSVDGYGVLSNWYIRAEALDINSRPVAPELSVDLLAKRMSLKATLSRDTAGIAGTSFPAGVYVGYSALRKDVTAVANNPGLLVFASMAEVDALIGPVVPENPLAFGLQKAFDNATGFQVTALGVDETTADAPDGSVAAYERALEYMETKEVSVIAIMTFNEEAHKKLLAHVLAMSAIGGKKERSGLTCGRQPTEMFSTLCLSGNMLTSVEIGDGKYELTLTDVTKSFVSALDGLKAADGTTLSISAGTDLGAEQGVYIDRAGDPWKYLVTKVVDAHTVQIETAYPFGPDSGPGTTGNGDGYFKVGDEALADYAADGDTCVLYIRQAALDDTTTTGKGLICDAMAARGQSLGSRRMTSFQPDYMGASVGGVEQVVAGYFVAAAWAGLTASQPPAQGFTNFPIQGFTRPIGSNDKFSEKLMAQAAGGGVNWIIQDEAGGTICSRHQLTTDVSSLKTREYSVTKAVDKVVKQIRAAAKPYTGKRNLTRKLLEEISFVLNAVMAVVSGSDVAEASLDAIGIDPVSPDTTVLQVSLVPFYPNNKIKITILV